MSSQSRVATCLTWVGSSLLFHQLPMKSANAIEISTSIIRRKTKEKLILLNPTNSHPELQQQVQQQVQHVQVQVQQEVQHDRQLQSSSSLSLSSLSSSSTNGLSNKGSSFNSNNSELTPRQYAQCLTDLQSADENADGKLDQYEFLNFLSFNSGYNGYPWGYYAATSSSELPLEFPMLFHSTACMCAYDSDNDNDDMDFDCCEGENGHVIVYGEEEKKEEDDNNGNMTPDQVAYTRLFCTEAFYSYTVDFVPTKSPSDVSSEPSARPTTTRPTPSPTVVRTARPTTTRPTPSPTTVVRTPKPTGVQLDPTTAAPTPSPTTKPTVAVATTSSPTKMVPVTTPSPTAAMTSWTPTEEAKQITARPTTPSPTLIPVVSPPTMSPQSSNPTNSPSTSPVVPPTSSSPTSNTVSIDITYGISSNCGMTAKDVMEGTGGITINEGLVSATEVVVVEILNATYPRADEDVLARNPVSMMSPGSEVRMRAEGLNGNNKFNKSGARMEGLSLHPLEMIEETTKPGVGVRVRVDELTPRSGARRRLAILATTDKGQHQPLRQQHHQMPRSNRDPHANAVVNAVDAKNPLPVARERQRERERALVYYTPTNPIVIIQVEDVMCQATINCMRVRSTVYLELEEGDDEAIIRATVLAGIQGSINDGALFNKIPQNTVFCPVATFPPVSPTTSSPTLSPVATPTTMAPTTMAPTTDSPVAATRPPTMAPQDLPTLSPIVTGEPTTSPTMDLSLGGGGPIKVSITYDLSNDCGLKAEAIMNEEGNTLKEGLVAATTTITVGILNTTFPRVDSNNEPQRRNNVRARQRRHLLQQRRLALLDLPSKLTTTTSLSFAEEEDGDASSSSSSRHHRNLVYYTEEYPVSIENIFDMDAGCAPGNSCLLVISTITVVLEAGDDPVEVDKAIVSGMQDSFSDGRFSDAIPADTVICL